MKDETIVLRGLFAGSLLVVGLFSFFYFDSNWMVTLSCLLGSALVTLDLFIKTSGFQEKWPAVVAALVPVGALSLMDNLMPKEVTLQKTLAFIGLLFGTMFLAFVLRVLKNFLVQGLLRTSRTSGFSKAESRTITVQNRSHSA